jgi:hypothetical protein
VEGQEEEVEDEVSAIAVTYMMYLSHDIHTV